MNINSLLNQISMNQTNNRFYREPNWQPEPENTAAFPSLSFPYLQQMDCIIRLEIALCGKGDCISIGLKNAIRSNTPATMILNTVRDLAVDNYGAVGNLIGVELTDKILGL